MQKEINIGDLCKSTAGRDKTGIFLVIGIDGKFAYVVDGKVRKVKNPKKKNLKHLERLNVKPLVGIAEMLHINLTVGNNTIKTAVKERVNKKQED